MGMFSSIFGSSGSDKADRLRQQAIDAFNSIKTPELSALQVQLNDYVNAGKITPEQAEATLLKSNAFESIKTDPALTGAAKQALSQLQDIGSKGGLDAVSKAKLADVTAQQEQENRSQNEAIMQGAKQRGTGGSDLTTVNQLVTNQGAADRAARSGTQVAADASTRALQAIQAAGGLGQSLEAQEYGEEANKANAKNAIEKFNAETQTGTNLENTRAANSAQAANVENAQNIANLNTGNTNQNKIYNAQQEQTVFNDNMGKAAGVAGTLNNWANDASATKKAETGADMGLLSGAINAGAIAGGTALAGPAGGMVAGQATAPSNSFGETGSTGFNKKTMSTNPYGYSEGGEVADRGIEDEYRDFITKYCYGGKVNMADGGVVHIKPAKKVEEPTPALSIETSKNNDNSGWTLSDVNHEPIGDFKTYSDAADYEKKVREKQPNVQDFLKGGKVPGVAPVAGDSPMNDVVKANLSPGEVVVPRTVVQHPEQIPAFVSQATNDDPLVRALQRLKNPSEAA